jgi:hypothetical protein
MEALVVLWRLYYGFYASLGGQSIVGKGFFGDDRPHRQTTG